MFGMRYMGYGVGGFLHESKELETMIFGGKNIVCFDRY